MNNFNKSFFIKIIIAIFILSLSITEFSSFALFKTKKLSQIFGLIKVEKNNIYLIKNWLSRSKISYQIKGKLRKDIARYNNSLAIISGNISDKSSWSKDLYAVKINRIWKIKKKNKISGFIEVKDKKIYIKEILFPFLKQGLYYEVKGRLKDSILEYEGKSIKIEGIITQKDNWNSIFIDVKKIIE